MRHLLLHAAGNLRARALRLIQLHDIALLCACMTGDDWRELLDGSAGGRALWWALAPLTLTQYYYRARVPEPVTAAAGAACPALLRRACQHQLLTDVSWSNLRIQAFPGIEWSRSPIEALRFAAGRVWPDRESLSDLALGTRSASYGSATSWYSDAHIVRILRWVFSNPPRVQTIHSVKLALGQDWSDG